MDAKGKTDQILALLERRTTLSPFTKFSVDPRLAKVERFPWDTAFSPFNERHMQAASTLYHTLISAPDFEDFLKLADQVRIIQNDDLFLYVLYTAVLHRDDCRDVTMPAIEEIAPNWFFAAETIHEAIQLSIHRPNQDHVVVNQRTAESTEIESKLAYFREDIGCNSHHWAWHVVFPTIWDSDATGIVKDRKGELFYYMHQQMLARYACARISNGMRRERPFENFLEKLGGYSPHLTSETTGVHYGHRSEGLVLRDMPTLRVQDLELWRSRIYDAIDRKVVVDERGTDVPLDNVKGIDILGVIVRANSDSINKGFYGNLHNMGHNLIAAIHDPDGSFRVYPGVMGFNETAPRDPMFYRWHAFNNDLFERHKRTLTPYGKDELVLSGITVLKADVKAEAVNVLETFIKEDYANLSHAPFLKTEKQILVKYKRLEPKPFEYRISIENSNEIEKNVTIRIFLAPKTDELGKAFELEEQRTLMMEMDKFHAKLEPGINEILRQSESSSVTVSRRAPSFSALKSGDYETSEDYCICGWPQHLLVPKGTPKGLECVLFVMCTDYEEDTPEPSSLSTSCGEAISFCGAKDRRYPDTKPMGYPFDRKISGSWEEDFLTDNMKLTNVLIRFLGFVPESDKETPVSMNTTA